MTDVSQLARLGLFDARVPRYTSYPTAPHFSSATTAQDFAGWISTIAAGSQISLYIHVPFCRRLCWFCACRTQGTHSDAPALAYLDTLLMELELLRNTLPQGITLSRMHWGGGTPTMLPAPAITRLAGAVLSAFPFAPGAEFSVEIDPNEIDAPRMDALVSAGMTRASVGVQDFNPDIQRVIGRDQSFDITRDVIAALRAHGVASLNADILYGLPNQTNASITSTVQKLLSIDPDRVALYGYAHVPWVARRQQMIPSDTLPRPETRLELFNTARRLFLWDGYTEIGIDHFARAHDGLAIAAGSGRLRRNFQGYTDDQSTALIGLGASSISKLPQGYAQNAPATATWKKAVMAGQFATTRGHALNDEDKLRARIIEALMCDFHVGTDALIRDFDVSRAAVAALLQPVADRFGDLVTLSPAGLAIPPASRPLTRMIAAMFDAYELDKAAHSTAV